jgi:protein-tyrosine sulfotransferase
MRFIFVGGCPRSGTTLVQKILLSHTAITGSREFEFLTPLVQLYDQMRTPLQLERQSYFYSGEELKKYWKGFIEQLLVTQVADKNKYKYFSEKTPLNSEVAIQLLELFEDSKFIYIYRDGRDVVNSFKQANKRAKQAGEKVYWGRKGSAFIWRQRMQSYFKLKEESRFKERYLAIKYEDLVSEPERIINQMMLFLGMKVEEKQLQPEKFTTKEFDERIDKAWYTKDLFEQKINKGNVAKWKKELSLFEKIKCQVIMADYLRDSGYPVSGFYLAINPLYLGVRRLGGRTLAGLGLIR